MTRNPNPLRVFEITEFKGPENKILTRLKFYTVKDYTGKRFINQIKTL